MIHAEVAQSVEQGTENPRVGSSILSLGTIYVKGAIYDGAFRIFTARFGLFTRLLGFIVCGRSGLIQFFNLFGQRLYLRLLHAIG